MGDIYFTDIFTIDFNASIDPNYVRGRGSGWANATTLARPICKPTLPTNAYARCGAMTYTMYEVSTPGEYRICRRYSDMPTPAATARTA